MTLTEENANQLIDTVDLHVASVDLSDNCNIATPNRVHKMRDLLFTFAGTVAADWPAATLSHFDRTKRLFQVTQHTLVSIQSKTSHFL